MLVDAMEQVSRPEFRSLPCDPSVLTALGAQLNARPRHIPTVPRPAAC
jgi:hypothetical protein